MRPTCADWPAKVRRSTDGRGGTALWLHSNETFVPAAELRISVYVRPGVFLVLPTGAGVGFFRQSIFEPGEPQCAMPAALLMALPPKSVRARADQTLAASRSAGCDETIFVAHDKILKRTAAIVWPETASPALLQTDIKARQLIAEAANGVPVLAGAVRFDEGDRPRNSLFALGADGLIEGIYDKWHLVPFGEYQPDWLPTSLQLVPGGGFARGPGPRRACGCAVEMSRR